MQRNLCFELCKPEIWRELPGLDRVWREMTNVGHATIFGGTGFIGTHLAQHLLNQGLAGRITLVNLMPPRTSPIQHGFSRDCGQVAYVRWDVRQPIPALLTPESPEIVFNLAAIHESPDTGQPNTLKPIFPEPRTSAATPGRGDATWCS